MTIGRINLESPFLPSSPARSKLPKQTTFATALQQATDQVAFSQHALLRLKTRQINLTQADLDRLDKMVGQMARKGAKESLIYMKDTAFVVSIDNRTVITAMDGDEMKENIFTNIDSAAIL